MNSKMIGVVLFIAGCFASQAASLVIPPARAQDMARRWDYQCAYVSAGRSAMTKEGAAENTTATLKKYGAQGWELVGIDNEQVACFKRPL